MIDQTVHITNEKLPCIDLLFTNNSWRKQTIHDKYHDNNIFESLNLNIHFFSMLLYYKEVWNYKKAVLLSTQPSISLVKWNVVFSNKTAE